MKIIKINKIKISYNISYYYSTLISFPLRFVCFFLLNTSATPVTEAGEEEEEYGQTEHNHNKSKKKFYIQNYSSLLDLL